MTRTYKRPSIAYAPQFGNLLNEFFNTAVGDVVHKAETKHFTNPAVNAIEYETKLELQLALPGFTKEDVIITVENDVLSIESKEKETENSGKYRLREFNYAGFKKNFRLPEDIDPAQVEAMFAYGILTITLGKKKEAIPQPPRTITVQ